MGILSVLIALPMAGALGVMALRNSSANYLLNLSLLLTLLIFFLSIGVWLNFDTTLNELQFVERADFLPILGCYYFLGIDGLSLPLILLTTILMPVVILSIDLKTNKLAEYLAWLLLLEGLCIGFFASQDGLLFYIFFEATLVPMFFMIMTWGGENRIYAAFKFFIYTFVGSISLLLVLMFLGLNSGSFAFADLAQVAAKQSLLVQSLLLAGMVLPFAIKTPMLPVHTWLPDAHVQASTQGSMILAAILLKLGTYGMFRFLIPLAPAAFYEFAPWLILLSVAAIFYIGIIANIQDNMKKLIAYSSVAHMGFVTLGLFVSCRLDANLGQVALEGAYFQMISHGIISAGLFYAVGVLSNQSGTKMIANYGGVVNKMPVFSAMLLFFAFANSGLPGTSGFVGEFMVLLTVVGYDLGIALLAALSLVFAATYNLWMCKRVLFGPVVKARVGLLVDLDKRQFAVMFILAAQVLVLGIYPDLVLSLVHQSTHFLIQVY